MTPNDFLDRIRSAGPARSVGAALLTTFLLAGCDDGTGVDGPQDVSVSFRASQASEASAGPAAGPSAAAGAPAAATMELEGTNGTLVLDEVFMIVSEVELEGADDCDDDDGSDVDRSGECEDFEVDPSLVELPLDGTPVPAFSALIAPGVYTELELEVEDLDDDDDDKREALDALKDEIDMLVPDWPSDASVYVTGTFQPVDGDPEPFRTFIQAEIEIEMELEPGLVIGEDGTADRDLVVDVMPDLWFRDVDGGVMDLREWDYDSTGLLLEFELEIEEGFVEVEFDD